MLSAGAGRPESRQALEELCQLYWAPVRGYIEELLPDVLSGAIQPGRVFDLELPLRDAAEAYAAMDERRAIKVLLRP